ncbi:MAG: hypothetical protein ABSC73_09365 [Acidimicrobiales bacterium]
MSGVAVLLILAGVVAAWSGYNDLSFLTVIRSAVSKSRALPSYEKGAGARKAVAEVLGFELIKAAASGVSALLPASMIAAGGGKGAAAGGGGDGGKTTEETPTEETPAEETPTGEITPESILPDIVP